jgi:hypothetical protein
VSDHQANDDRLPPASDANGPDVARITLRRAVGLHIRKSLRGIVNASDDDCGEEKCRDCAPVRVMREALAALNAALAEPVAEQHPEKGPALTVYNEIAATDDPGSPLERLRFFCSLAMRPQDWLDVAPFFDALAEPEQKPDALRRDAERYRWLKSRAEDYDGHVCFGEVRYPAPIPDCTPFDAIDAAVDAAMQEDKT